MQRHAEVEECNLRLLFTRGCLSILVEDAGKGFGVEQMEDARNRGDGDGHFGLLGMEERAKLIGASLNVISKPGEGTKVHIKLPCPVAS